MYHQLFVVLCLYKQLSKTSAKQENHYPPTSLTCTINRLFVLCFYTTIPLTPFTFIQQWKCKILRLTYSKLVAQTKSNNTVGHWKLFYVH